MEQKTLKINNVEYVRADSVSTNTPQRDGLDYCIVRTYSAGVFAGYFDYDGFKKTDSKKGEVFDARRLWYWSGASSLSQAAQEGFKNPSDCKFPCEVPSVVLSEIIEVLPCTEQARKSIKDVTIWQWLRLR